MRDHEPALWAHTQDYTGPDGRTRTRRGFFCRVRIEDYGPGRVRPHERTHPGPKEDRLRLTRATRANISPIFSLYSDPRDAAWDALAPATARGAVGRGRPTPTAPSTASGASPTRRRSPPCRPPPRDAELLIADGHHRYETMQAYAEEIGGEGEHRYVLMCLVALEDPGLTVFPTHRLVRGLDERPPGGARAGARARLRDRPRCRSSRSRPPRGERPAAARLHRRPATSAPCA